MTDLKSEKWTPADLDILLDDVIAVVESGEVDSAFDNAELTSGHLTRAKNTRNYTSISRMGTESFMERKFCHAAS